MGMFDNDIIYGGEQLQPNVTVGEEYVLWECGIVARDVTTSLGADGVKAEVVISQLQGTDRSGEPAASVPAKYGTFASSIVEKVAKKGDGDLPAVIKFEIIPAKDAAKQDAFVMSFVRKWTGDPPAGLPELSPFIGAAAAMPEPSSIRTLPDGRTGVMVGDTFIEQRDNTPKVESPAAKSKRKSPDGADHPLS